MSFTSLPFFLTATSSPICLLALSRITSSFHTVFRCPVLCLVLTVTTRLPPFNRYQTYTFVYHAHPNTLAKSRAVSQSLREISTGEISLATHHFVEETLARYSTQVAGQSSLGLIKLDTGSNSVYAIVGSRRLRASKRF